MTVTRTYQFTFGLISLFALGYLSVSLFEFMQLRPQLANLSPLPLPLIQIFTTTLLAVVTLILIRFALVAHQQAAYWCVVSFWFMYLAREVLLLMQLNQGVITAQTYQFSFLYLGLIMIIETVAFWVIPRFFSTQTS